MTVCKIDNDASNEAIDEPGRRVTDAVDDAEEVTDGGHRRAADQSVLVIQLAVVKRVQTFFYWVVRVPRDGLNGMGSCEWIVNHDTELDAFVINFEII